MSLEDHSHISKKALLKHFDIPLIEDLVSQKRIRWVGHALRRHEKDRSRIAVTSCLDDASSSWTKLVQKDCSKMKIRFKDIQELSTDKPKLRRISHWRSFHSLK